VDWALFAGLSPRVSDRLLPCPEDCAGDVR
jgi:hypothetical protein